MRMTSSGRGGYYGAADSTRRLARWGSGVTGHPQRLLQTAPAALAAMRGGRLRLHGRRRTPLRHVF